MESMFGTMLDAITLALVAFAAVSLVVSTIMIAIIIYVSVIERTKEIGILRPVGARKKDISRVFNAEALIIGFTAGLMGVGIRKFYDSEEGQHEYAEWQKKQNKEKK